MKHPRLGDMSQVSALGADTSLTSPLLLKQKGSLLSQSSLMQGFGGGGLPSLIRRCVLPCVGTALFIAVSHVCSGWQP